MLSQGQVTDRKLINSNNKRIATYFVLTSYFCQGIASLIYQVTWEQATEKIIGVALPAATMLVAIFIGGMAIGAFTFDKLKPKIFGGMKAPVLYAFSQLLLFVFGITFAASQGWQFIGNISVQGEQWLSIAYSARLFLAGMFILFPAILIGAAFPVLLKLSILCQLKVEARTLYFFNVSGSVIGSLFAGFVLLPHFGMVKTVLLGASLHFLAGLFVLAIAKMVPSSSPYSAYKPKSYKPQSLSKTEERGKYSYHWPCVIGVAAFANMFLELLYVRLFNIFAGSSNFAYTLIVSVQLVALAGGTCWASSKFVNQQKSFFSIASYFYLFASACLLMQIYFLAKISNAFLLLPFMFVSCFALGCILPLYFKFKENNETYSSPSPGQAFAINLFSSLAGCISGGIIAIPLLSLICNHALYWALILLTITLLCTGLWTYCIHDKNYARNDKLMDYSLVLVTVLVSLGLILVLFMPKPLLSTNRSDQQQILYYKEGVNSTVSVGTNKALNITYLQIDGQMQAALPLNKDLPAPSSDEITQTLLGILPIMFSSSPAKVFLLGYGSGRTAHSILLDPRVQTLTVAELEAAVVKASKFFDPYFTNTDGRLSIKAIDGRNLLSMLEKKYDLIISQPGEPYRSSSAYLYTLEFWQLAKRRLRTGGVFCQWLPLYAIDQDNLFSLCRTFFTVFPNTFIFRPERAGEIILLAVNNTAPRLTNLALISEVKPDLLRYGYRNKGEILAMARLTPQSLKNWLDDKGEINSDDFPFVQYRLQDLVNQGKNGISLDIDQLFSCRD